MKEIFKKLKDTIAGPFRSDDEYGDDFSDDYVELDTNKTVDMKNKILIRPFIIEDFGDIKQPIDAVREGYTIALLNIRPIKEKDITELKRAVSKMKKTCEAIEGDIAGFGDDWLVLAPSFAKIHREE